MDSKYLVPGLIGVVAAIGAIRAYQVSGLSSAIISLLIAGWILIHLTTKKQILGGLATLLKPFQTAVNFLLLGFLYGSLEGNPFWISVGISVIGSLLGGAISMWLYKYWNIA